MKRPLLLGAALLAMTSLAACGLTGDLKRPAPLWGEPDGAIDAADLPDEAKSDLPPLPEREPQATTDDADDELLGGTGGN
ncbi:MAG: hypothetical protein V7675_17915 [Hyphomonas sp.]|uniref:LPS translocon maturation chaperone LptM n=1 Tax=Hyphomonas sp. TaxID=87 RepID=UPI003001D219